MASTQYSCATAYVMPTRDDINGGLGGRGRVPTEATLRSLIGFADLGRNAVSGFAPPANASSPSNYAMSGGARIGGYLVGMTSGNWTISLPYATNLVVLRILTAGAKAIGVVVEVFDSVALPVPALSIPLWQVTVAGTTTLVADYRRTGQVVSGAIMPSSHTIPDMGSGNWSWATIPDDKIRVTFQHPFHKTPRFVALDGQPAILVALATTHLDFSDVGATLFTFMVVD